MQTRIFTFTVCHRRHHCSKN